MAAELYKPFIIRKMLERGVVKTVKSAKKIVDAKEALWCGTFLENVMKAHPVLLNRAPTLHRLGIQAFQPKIDRGQGVAACTHWRVRRLTLTSTVTKWRYTSHWALRPVLEAQLVDAGQLTTS